MPSLLILYPHKKQAQSDSLFENYFNQKCGFTWFYPQKATWSYNDKVSSPSFVKESMDYLQGQILLASNMIKQKKECFAFTISRKFMYFPSQSIHCAITLWQNCLGNLRGRLHWWHSRAESRISFSWKNSNRISHNSGWYLCCITLFTFIRAGEPLCSGPGQVAQGGNFSPLVPCGHHGERTGKRRRLTKGKGLLHSVSGFWPDSVGKKYPSPMPPSQEATGYLVIWEGSRQIVIHCEILWQKWNTCNFYQNMTLVCTILPQQGLCCGWHFHGLTAKCWYLPTSLPHKFCLCIYTLPVLILCSLLSFSLERWVFITLPCHCPFCHILPSSLCFYLCPLAA